ncbi:hypothetical protein PIB30_082029, partial [Stylosanthes scabra]|nr:hypothetical protein [Stylosanthes scabra]
KEKDLVGDRDLVRATIRVSLKYVTEVQPSLKIPSTGLGSFSLRRKNRGPISTLGVPPKAIGAFALALGCVRTGSRNGLLGFVCDLLVPLALFSHFRSELCLLKLETLERTHQGIKWNGKRFKIQ